MRRHGGNPFHIGGQELPCLGSGEGRRQAGLAEVVRGRPATADGVIPLYKALFTASAMRSASAAMVKVQLTLPADGMTPPVAR